jgi:hypothetical protein
MVTLPSISAEYLPNSDIMPANGGSVINAGLHVFQNGKLPVRDLVNDSRPPTNMRLGGAVAISRIVFQLCGPAQPRGR